MGIYQRYMKRIYKQYGKNIKSWEDREKEGKQELPKEIEDLYKKYKLDLATRKPFISVRHYRWGNCVPEERRIDTFEKLESISLEK
jgi:predicted metal-dependent hydrolase